MNTELHVNNVMTVCSVFVCDQESCLNIKTLFFVVHEACLFLIRPLFVWSTSHVQSVDDRHSHVTNCAPVLRLVHLFARDILYIEVSQEKRKDLAWSFNFTFLYIWMMSIHKVIPTQLEINNFSKTARSASYINIQLVVDNEDRLGTFQQHLHIKHTYMSQLEPIFI
jgi:hypothetical protein